MAAAVLIAGIAQQSTVGHKEGNTDTGLQPDTDQPVTASEADITSGDLTSKLNTRRPNNKMSQEEFLLKWNDHHASFFTIVEDLCRTEQLCDVTLACGGQVFETHKLILSVCSPYFRTLLNSRPDKHPIVYLKDVNPKHLEQLLSYMYRGEINVLQDDLGPLIETARGLQIKVRDCETLPGLVLSVPAGHSVVRI